MKTVVIGSMTLGTGLPKIGVSLTGSTRSALLGQAAQVLTSVAQVVEWRLDTYQELDNRAELINTAAQLRQVLGTIPVIATLRPATAGGQTQLDTATYYQTYQTLVSNRAVDAVDIALSMVNAADFMTLTKQMRTDQIRLILSQTTTTKTPAEADLLATYQAMAAAGADIARITITAHTALEVLRLMTATAQAQQTLALPLIATAKGSLGRYSSVSGQLFGSTVTFGQVGHGDGRGSLPVSQLKQTLQTLSPVGEGQS